MFQFKQDDVEFVSDTKLSRELGYNYISPWSKHTFKADIRNAKARILERRNNNMIDRTAVKTEPFIKTELVLKYRIKNSARMKEIFCC